MDQQFGGVPYSNWYGDFPSRPQVVVTPTTVEEIVEIVKNPGKYPSPIRAVGSNHSTTECSVANGGTVIKMSRMNRIVEIGKDYVTAQAGAQYIDVGNELAKRGLQYYVNIELGNLTFGSGVTCGTKDGSHPGEFGQVNAYATSIKLVTPSGELMEVTEEKDPELMQAMRSSYGLLGIVYEATIMVRPTRRMRVEHYTYSFEEFEKAYPELRKREVAMTYFASPMIEKITVELQRPADKPDGPVSRWGWKLRNNIWALYGPGFSALCTNYIPIAPLRNFLLSASQWLQLWALTKILHQKDVHPFDQMIRYGEHGGAGKYTFSLWGFPEEKFATVLREYAKFSADYFKRTGLSYRRHGRRLQGRKGHQFAAVLYLRRDQDHDRPRREHNQGLARVSGRLQRVLYQERRAAAVQPIAVSHPRAGDEGAWRETRKIRGVPAGSSTRPIVC